MKISSYGYCKNYKKVKYKKYKKIIVKNNGLFIIL